MRCRYLIGIVMSTLCAVSAIGAWFGANIEEIVDCNGGDGWEASVSSARPGASDYIISIVDRNSVKLRAVSKNYDKGTRMTSGKFEWRGAYVERVSVFVKAKKVSASAYGKIHALLKSKPECAITVECSDFPGHATLTAIAFPKLGKKFEAGEDGKVREVLNTK